MSWAKAKNIITTSATKRCVVKLCNFYGNVVCACVNIVVFEEAKCIVHEEIIEREWDSYGPLWETCIVCFNDHILYFFAKSEHSTHLPPWIYFPRGSFMHLPPIFHPSFTHLPSMSPLDMFDF